MRIMLEEIGAEVVKKQQDQNQAVGKIDLHNGKKEFDASQMNNVNVRAFQTTFMQNATNSMGYVLKCK